MKNIFSLCLLLSLLTACASQRSASSSFDLGPLPAAKSFKTATGERTVKVMEVIAPSGLDSTLMFYRLNYANAQQSLPYANSRWSVPPAQMLTQRIKSRLAQAGIRVLAANDSVNAPLLKIELEDFSHQFSQANLSHAAFSWRVSLIQQRQLLQQTNLKLDTAAKSHDATGGAFALARASDEAIDGLTEQVLNWLPAVNNPANPAKATTP